MNLTKLRSALGELWTQLRSGSGTEGEDCGAIACINLIKWASHGKVGPKSQAELAGWVRQVRVWANRPTGPMLVEGDIFQVLNSKALQEAFSHAGVGRMYAWYHYGIPWGELRGWLAGSTDHAAMVAILYGAARHDGAPAGSESFDGGHAVTMHGMARLRIRIKGKFRKRWQTVVGDSLMDGRRRPGSLRRYPKGYVRARFYRYRRAAGSFGKGPNGESRPIGQGRAIAITVRRGS